MKWSELRVVLFIQRDREGGLGTFIQVVKVGLNWALDSGSACEISDRRYMPLECDAIGRTLETAGFVQRGCFVGDDKAWAVAWLKAGDEPELLSDAMGQKIVPATLMWHFSIADTPGHIYTSKSAGQIRGNRARRSCASGDLAVSELPTMARRLAAYGIV